MMDRLIMIVEDDIGIRETIVDIIEALEYQSLEASNGLEALNLLERYKPDLILSDLMMPHMDGLQLLETLKQDERLCSIPVIIITAKVDREARLESYEIGADGYVTKPFDLQELSYKIRNLITLKENLINDTISIKGSSRPEWSFIQRLNKVLDSNLDDCSLIAVAESMNLSPSGLQKKLKRFSDKSFQEYVRIHRLAKAKSLLESGTCNVSETCERVGFKSLSGFSKSFKEQFGYSPKQILV